MGLPVVIKVFLLRTSSVTRPLRAKALQFFICLSALLNSLLELGKGLFLDGLGVLELFDELHFNKLHLHDFLFLALN